MKLPLIILTFSFLSGCFSKDPEKTGLEGKPIPEFSILLSDSITYFNTNSIPKGKPFAIFYFSPYCPYCLAQIDEIIEDMHKLRHMQFYMVTSFPIPDMRKLCNDFKLANYTNILVGQDTANFVADYFETTKVPYMAIYGKDKKLHKTFLGKIYSSQIKKVAEE